MKAVIGDLQARVKKGAPGMHVPGYSKFSTLSKQNYFLFLENGRWVFDDRITRLWWCPACARFRPWNRGCCPACGSSRDSA